MITMIIDYDDCDHADFINYDDDVGDHVDCSTHRQLRSFGSASDLGLIALLSHPKLEIVGVSTIVNHRGLGN